jgi:hypothetical protein
VTEADEKDSLIERAAVAQVARMNEIYRLRGQYISDLTALEDTLDQGISSYFGRKPFDPLMRQGILARLGFEVKLGLVKDIIRECELSDYFSASMQAWTQLAADRSKIAHSYLGLGEPPAQVIGTEEIVTMLESITAYKMSKSGHTAMIVEEAELRDQVALLVRAQVMAQRFMLAVVMKDVDGGSARDAILRLDEMNPDLPRIE